MNVKIKFCNLQKKCERAIKIHEVFMKYKCMKTKKQ